MSPADQQAASCFAEAVRQIRGAKHSLSQGRQRLPLCPRDTECLQLAAELLRIERRIAALAVPVPTQQVMREVAA